MAMKYDVSGNHTERQKDETFDGVANYASAKILLFLGFCELK